jgi:unsaturated chondroitin disaccharide hydrolase
MSFERTYKKGLELLANRTQSTLSEMDTGFPYVADPKTGEWTVTNEGNWCGGHWIGMLWLTYDITNEARFRKAANRYTEVMLTSHPVENMFYGMNLYYAGFRAYDISQDSRYRKIGIRGADQMIQNYHKGARQIPLGTLRIQAPASNFRGPTSDNGPSGAHLGAVDAIYTSLPVLWRAYRETGDERYRDIAISHADRHLDWYIRKDGSTWHHAEFDSSTGELIRQYNELAYSDDTCWARGQGWCIAGLARAYRETNAQRYLMALRSVTDYYKENTPEDLVPYWDFKHPEKPDVYRDTSAAALACYGLTRLPCDNQTGELHKFGDQILRSLLQDYMTPLKAEDERPNGMVLESCFNGPAEYADHHEHVWTDYYLYYTLHNRAAECKHS